MVCNKRSFKSGRRGEVGMTLMEVVREGEDLKLPRSDVCGKSPSPHYLLDSFSYYAQLTINFGRTKQYSRVGFSFKISEYIVYLRGLCPSVNISVLLHQESK